FQFGVAYDTAVEALAAIPPAVRQIIEAIPNMRFDRCHFLTYGDTALQFEVVYFVISADFNAYADAQQAINLAILERLRALKVNFAAATPTVVSIENLAPAAARTLSEWRRGERLPRFSAGERAVLRFLAGAQRADQVGNAREPLLAEVIRDS